MFRLVQGCPAGCGEGSCQHMLDSALLHQKIIVQFLKHLLKKILEEFSESCSPLVSLKVFLGESPLNYEEANSRELSWEWEVFHPCTLCIRKGKASGMGFPWVCVFGFLSGERAFLDKLTWRAVKEHHTEFPPGGSETHWLYNVP